VRDEDLDLFHNHAAHGHAIRVENSPHGMIWGESAARVTSEILRWLGTLPKASSNQ
jgi:hypothetical protein